MASEHAALPPHVAVLGINHASSNAVLRDRLLFPGAKLEAGLKALRGVEYFRESMILSTCNRVELYVVVDDTATARQRMLEFLSTFHDIARADFEDSTYFYHCGAAIEHLYRVVASLDSMVIGEYQILGQVKDAYQLACHRNNTGTILNKLFHFAIEGGKRVRTETKISEGVVSISSVAVDLARKIVGNLKGSAALIIGAGEMSKLTARHLASAGVERMYFANRTRERAMDLASVFGGTPLTLDEWPDILPQCDIVVSSTGAPHYVVRPGQIRKSMAARKNQPVFLIDIAAPKDIDPTTAKLYNVFLYCIDDLSEVVKDNTRMRAAEIGGARKILAQEAEKYFEWYNTMKVIPTLVTMRKTFETMCEEELERYSSTIGALPEDVQQTIQQFASSLTKKFLRTPSKVLREKAASGDGVGFASAVADLFDLDISNHE